MPLFSIVKFWAGLAALAILALAAWMLWTWWRGAPQPPDRALLGRDSWRLWVGLGLGLWWALGRFVVLGLLARQGRAKAAPMGISHRLEGPSGSWLHVETLGPVNAPVVIFTHGWGMASPFWTEAAADLSDRFRIVLWDLPGLGRSRLPADGSLDLRGFAADLAGLVKQFGRGAPVLVGHGFGGMVIQTMVRDYPSVANRLGGVVLLNSTYTNPLRTMILAPAAERLRPLIAAAMRVTVVLEPLVWLLSWQSYLSGGAHAAMRLGFGGRPTRGQLDQAALLPTKNPPAVQAMGTLAMLRWDGARALRWFQRPVLVVAGARDIVTVPRAGQRLAADARNGSLQLVPGAGHLGPKEQAQAYNRLIADFVLAVQHGASDAPASAQAEAQIAARRGPEDAGRDARPGTTEAPPRLS